MRIIVRVPTGVLAPPVPQWLAIVGGILAAAAVLYAALYAVMSL